MMRMALNLDLNYVMAVSSATEGKPEDTDGILLPVGTNTSGEWKLTLIDPERNFSADIAEDTVLSQMAGYSGWTVDIMYSGAVSDSNEFISAFLCDSDGNSLYYGSVSAQTEGTVSFSVPEELAEGVYMLLVFNEQKNADLQSDYSSIYQAAYLSVISAEFGSADLVLPADVTAVEESAFEGDQSISTVEIPETCTAIDQWAFRNCTNLTKIRIPDTCAIGEDAFDGCTKVYIYSTAGSPADLYCREHDNCVFMEESVSR